MDNEIILLNINGEDRPGISSSLTDILSKYGVQVLDIGQAVIHDNLSLGIMFRIPKKTESSPILKDLLFKSYELNVQIKFTPIVMMITTSGSSIRERKDTLSLSFRDKLRRNNYLSLQK